MKTVSLRVPTLHITAMIKGMKKAKVFQIDKTKNTVIVKTSKDQEVFRALKMGSIDLWVVRHTANLFI